MGTFLQVLGVIFLIVIILLVVLILMLRSKYREFEKSLKSGKKPDRIHLKEDFDAEWTSEDEEVQEMIELLLQYGFVRGRTYFIPEMPDVGLTALFHEENKACCVIYDHDREGVWADFVVVYEDGQELTFSNAPHGKEIDHRPEVIKYFYPKASFKGLFRKFRKGITMKPMITITDKNFKEIFEQSYEKDMAWRNERGGVTDDEMRRVARNMDADDFSEDEDDEPDGIYELHETCMDEFIRNTTMSVAQWEKYQSDGEFIIVSDEFDSEEFAEYLCDYADLSEREEKRLIKSARNAGSVRQIFEKVNRSFPSNQRAKKVDAYAHPIEFDVYWIPVSD